MFHRRAFRKLGRKHQHRLATLRSLSTALFERERIQTTLMKAKELRPFAEKLITKSKRDDLHARRLVLRHIQDRDVARKLFDSLSARFMDRPGGYVRIMKLGRRQGDGAEMALVELLGSEPVFKKKEQPKKTAKKGGIASRLMGKGRPKELGEKGKEPGAQEAGRPEAKEAGATGGAPKSQPGAAAAGAPKGKKPRPDKPTRSSASKGRSPRSK